MAGSILVKASAFLLMVLGAASPLAAQAGLTGPEIDALAGRAMRSFEVPGIAVGVVRDGRVVHAAGYGVRETGRSARVDAHTLFSIGSITKTFTAGAIALLVDEGRLGWDDAVVDRLPGFRLADPWMTREARIRDILSHRLDLSPGAGGLMFYASSDFPSAELVANMRFFRSSAPFRSRFVYDNLAYVAAGEIVAAASGLSYEDFVDRRILRPLGMNECAASTARLANESNNALPHAIVDGRLQVVRRLVPMTARAPYAAAGGIYCSLADMLKYAQAHLDGGRLADGSPLFSAQQHAQMWTPQTLGSVSDRERDWDDMHFASYGLGWQITDMHGFQVYSHGGGVPGVRSFILLIPRLRLGIVVLTNSEAREAMDSITAEIAKSYMPVPRQDWVARYAALRDETAARLARTASAAAPGPATGQPAQPLAAYAGLYRDPWLGEATVTQDANGLVLAMRRAPLMTGRLAPYSGNIFTVRWNERSLAADAYVDFDVGMGQAPNGMLLRPISPATSLIYDFHDLEFRRVEPPPRP